MRTSTAIGAILVLGVITLALVVGLRLNESGNGFTLGLLCGLAAALPASFISHYLSAGGEPVATPAQEATWVIVIMPRGEPGPARDELRAATAQLLREG